MIPDFEFIFPFVLSLNSNFLLKLSGSKKAHFSSASGKTFLNIDTK